MQQNQTINLRRYWRLAHRWTGFTVGWLLGLVGLTGAILIVAQPLDRWNNSQLFTVHPAVTETPANPAPTTLEAIRRNLLASFGDAASLTMRLPRNPDDTLRVTVRSESWNGSVYLNPATGEEQGRRGEYEGVVNLFLKFHSSLLLEDTGKAVLAGISIFYLILLISGVLLWWPKKWPPTMKIETRKGAFRALFDVHRTGGVVLGALMAITIATGVYMVWRPFSQFVTTVSGEKVVMPPKIGEKSVLTISAITIDELVRRAQAEFPSDPVTYVQIPAEKNRPIRVRMLLADDPHPNGRTSIWLHPDNGAVLAVDRWNKVDLGARAFSVVYPLHTGELGGPVLEALVFIIGLALGVLGVSGVWIWWRRRL